MADALQGGIGQNPVRQHDGRPPATRFQKGMDPLQEQDFRFDAGPFFHRPGSGLGPGVRPLAGYFVINLLIVFIQVAAQLELLQVAIALFRAANDGAKGRVGQDQVKLAGRDAGVLVPERRDKVQSVVAQDVGMAVIVNNHIHLGDPGQFLVNFNAKEVALGEVVPVAEMGNGAGRLLPVGFPAHMV